MDVPITGTNMLADIVEALPDGLIVIDGDGLIAIVNRQAELLFGYSRDEMCGQSVEALMPASIRGIHREHRRQYAEAPHARPMNTGRQFIGRRRDGTDFPVDVALSVIGTDGRGLIAASIRDVSHARATEARLAGLLDGAPDAIVGVDAHGTILQVNNQTRALFGYPGDELVGQSVDALVPHRFREIHPHHRAGYLADPRTRPMGAGLELAGLRKDGSEFPIDISLSAYEAGDGVTVTAAIRDISDQVGARKRAALEARDHQVQRLESLGQLAGGVAHDFNNLLAVIINYAEFIVEDANDPEAVRKDVDEIRSAAERAAALTHQLLIFGRREIIRNEILDINTVVHDNENLLRSAVGENVDIRVRTGSGISHVRADPTQIEQVLLNLAVNGRDAMKNGGTLVIETSSRTIGLEDAASTDLEPGSYVCIAVSDTGEGMSEDARRHAFEPFFTTKPKGEGTGLGLATVFGIATQAGGDVTLYSEPGLGTTVKVLLPATDEIVGRSSRLVRTPPSGNGKTVLLVEDEPQVLHLTKRILERHGYRVLVALTPGEASILLENDRSVDLLLTDVVMPELSGPQLAERARQVVPGLRVLFMSGYPREVWDKGGIDDEFPLVEKPFSADALLDRVALILADPVPRPAGRA